MSDQIQPIGYLPDAGERILSSEEYGAIFIEIDNIELFLYSEATDGQGGATEVHLICIPENPTMSRSRIRMTSAESLDKFIAMLQIQRKRVWGD